MGVKTESIMATIMEDEIDLEWLLLLDMSETIEKFGRIVGAEHGVVHVGENVEIRIEDRNPRQPMMGRLIDVIKAVGEVVDASGMDTKTVCMAVLEADGWSWTPRNLRAPLWMINHEEVGRTEIARKFKELEWLEISSSETL